MRKRGYLLDYLTQAERLARQDGRLFLAYLIGMAILEVEGPSSTLD